jgi:hypothetical protein
LYSSSVHSMSSSPASRGPVTRHVPLTWHVRNREELASADAGGDGHAHDLAIRRPNLHMLPGVRSRRRFNGHCSLRPWRCRRIRRSCLCITRIGRRAHRLHRARRISHLKLLALANSRGHSHVQYLAVRRGDLHLLATTNSGRRYHCHECLARWWSICGGRRKYLRDCA